MSYLIENLSNMKITLIHRWFKTCKKENVPMLHILFFTAGANEILGRFRIQA
jgi:hypothetical protein